MKPHRDPSPSRFPRAARYNPDWLLASASGGANPLLLTEWLCEALNLRPGLRVLDLGCGRAASSIFLRREFGVEVWAVDLWFSPDENLQRIRDARVDDGVFPMRADARALPFAAGFFDVITSIDSYPYYGTDVLCLANLARFLRPGGLLGIAGAGLAQDFDAVPPHLGEWWAAERPVALRSAAWWRRHWEGSGVMDVERSDVLADGWKLWRDWVRTVAPHNVQELAALESDAGSHLGYVRTVGRLRPDAPLQDPSISIPPDYSRQPLLASEQPDGNTGAP